MLRVPASMVFEGFATDGGRRGPAGPSRGSADGGHVESMYGELLQHHVTLLAIGIS